MPLVFPLKVILAATFSAFNSNLATHTHDLLNIDNSVKTQHNFTKLHQHNHLLSGGIQIFQEQVLSLQVSLKTGSLTTTVSNTKPCWLARYICLYMTFINSNGYQSDLDILMITIPYVVRCDYRK